MVENQFVNDVRLVSLVHCIIDIIFIVKSLRVKLYQLMTRKMWHNLYNLLLKRQGENYIS